MKYIKLFEERDPMIQRLRSLGMAGDLAGMEWNLVGEIDGVGGPKEPRKVYAWTGPDGEMVVLVQGEIDNYKADYKIELSNGALIKVDVLIQLGRDQGQTRSSITVNGQTYPLDLDNWCWALSETDSSVIPALNLYTDLKNQN